MKLEKLTTISKSGFLLLALVIVLSFSFLTLREEEIKLEKKEEATLEMLINELSKINKLEKEVKEENYFLKFYFRLENQFFIILDDYYKDDSNREKLKKKVDYLLVKKNFLEQKIIN
jgi:hypothetical protein